MLQFGCDELSVWLKNNINQNRYIYIERTPFCDGAKVDTSNGDKDKFNWISQIWLRSELLNTTWTWLWYKDWNKH